VCIVIIGLAFTHSVLALVPSVLGLEFANVGFGIAIDNNTLIPTYY
jgi:hypothetical protein